MTAVARCLECQDCGTLIRELSADEAARVADRPYDFVVYCRGCRPARIRKAVEAAGDETPQLVAMRDEVAARVNARNAAHDRNGENG